MSTPTEQARALIDAEAFLLELASGTHSHRARAILRHYPGPATLTAWVTVPSWTEDVLRARAEMRAVFERESASRRTRKP